jgi:hypothetical protein
MAKLGQCCPVLELVLQRGVSQRARVGLAIAESINFKSGAMGQSLVHNMVRGKKGESYQNVTYAEAKFCPFCGTATATAEVTEVANV